MTDVVVARELVPVIRDASPGLGLPPWSEILGTGFTNPATRTIRYTPDLTAPQIVLVQSIGTHLPTAASHVGLGLAVVGGGLHPDLLTHDLLGLATDVELTTHAATAGHTHPNLAAHTSLGLAPTHTHPYEATGAVATHAAAGDPHPAYLTPAEGNAAYSTLAHAHAGTFEPAGAVNAHAAGVDPHPTYLTPVEGNGLYSILAHTHPGGSGPTVVKLTSNQVSAVTTFVDITGFTRPLAANEYCYFKAIVLYRANATTTGIRLGVNGPASPAVLSYRTSTSRTNAAQSAAGATDNEGTFISNTYDAPAADSGVAATGVDYIGTIEGVIQNGANAGTLAMRFASEVAVANGITLRPGSHVMFWTI